MTDFSDPIAVFREAVAAVNANDWNRAVACCDPVSLRAYHRFLCEQYAPAQLPSPMTAEILRRFQPDMPLEVAEYQATQQNRYHQTAAERLSTELPGISTPQALRAATPERAFTAWLEGRSPLRQVERWVKEGRASHKVLEQLATTPIELLNFEPIGAVNDGDRVTHVLYRYAGQLEGSPSMMGSTPLDDDERALAEDTWGRTHPKTVVLRRQLDDTWRILVEYDFLSLGSMTLHPSADVEEA